MRYYFFFGFGMSVEDIIQKEQRTIKYLFTVADYKSENTADLTITRYESENYFFVIWAAVIRH